MRRVPRAELVELFAIRLRTLPGYLKTALRRFSDANMNADQIAEHLAQAIDGDSSMVIVTDPVANGCYGKRPGHWGEDEPDPAGPARPRDQLPS